MLALISSHSSTVWVWVFNVPSVSNSEVCSKISTSSACVYQLCAAWRAQSHCLVCAMPIGAVCMAMYTPLISWCTECPLFGDTPVTSWLYMPACYQTKIEQSIWIQTTDIVRNYINAFSCCEFIACMAGLTRHSILIQKVSIQYVLACTAYCAVDTNSQQCDLMHVCNCMWYVPRVYHCLHAIGMHICRSPYCFAAHDLFTCPNFLCDRKCSVAEM
jgi:hypothetical protein